VITPARTETPQEPGGRAKLAAYAAILAACTVAAYLNTRSAPFVFDDVSSIAQNRSLSHLATALNPPLGTALSGRPIVSLTFALNRLISGERTWSYHALNLLFHVLSTLTLFGWLRRFPGLPAGERSGRRAAWAAIVALLWALHPIQTEAVTFLSERAEVLAGLLFLFSLYAFVRSLSAPRPAGWLVASIAACAIGAATKEVMFTLPIIVLLFDRAFVTGSAKAALRVRRYYYSGLFASWLIVGALIVQAKGRGGTVGLHAGISSWQYLLTQAEAIVTYLRLLIWPHGQVFDYGYTVASSFSAVAPQFLAVTLAVVVTAFTAIRFPRAGFAGAWFFIILAPSSSFVPLVTQTSAEHRLYLPAAAVVAAAMWCAFRWLGRPALWIGALLAFACGVLTFERNEVYRSAGSLWGDTVAKRPANARAWANLAHAYIEEGRWADALAAVARQRAVDPTYERDAHATRGRALLELGQDADALVELEAAAAESPGALDVRNNLAIAYARTGEADLAAREYAAIIAHGGDSAETHNNLANVLARQHRIAQALEEYATAIRLRPRYADAEANWAATLTTTGQVTEAVKHYARAAQLAPNDVRIRIAYGDALRLDHQPDEALQQYRSAVATDPNSAEVHVHIADVETERGDNEAAEAEYRTALQLSPNLAGAHHNLAVLLMSGGRVSEALPHFAATIASLPQSAEAHHEYALALAQVGRNEEARAEEITVLRLRPDFPEAKAALEALRN